MSFQCSIGEKIVWTAHPSWKGMLFFYIKNLFFVAITLAILGFMANKDALVSTTDVVLIGVVLVVFVAFWGWIRRRLTTYTITNMRVVQESGLIVRRRDECSLQRIQNTIVLINIFERLFGVGKINVDTAAEAAGAPLIIWGIEDPYAVASHLRASFPSSDNIDSPV